MCCQQCSAEGTAHAINTFEFTQNAGLVLCPDGKQRMAICIDNNGNTVSPYTMPDFFGVCDYSNGDYSHPDTRILVCGMIDGNRRVVPLFEPLQCINREFARTVEEKLCHA